MKKVITVKYFAILREQSGHCEETFESEALTASDLYSELTTRYGFQLTSCQLRVAVNNQFVKMDQVLQSHDQVVFIPPVAGG